jgi:hypothetical protein
MAKLRTIHDYKMDGYLNITDALNHEIDEVSTRIRAEAKDDDYARLTGRRPLADDIQKHDPPEES